MDVPYSSLRTKSVCWPLPPKWTQSAIMVNFLSIDFHFRSGATGAENWTWRLNGSQAVLQFCCLHPRRWNQSFVPFWGFFGIFRLCSRVFWFVHAVFKIFKQINMFISPPSMIKVLWWTHKNRVLHGEKRKIKLFTLCSRRFKIDNYSKWVRDSPIVSKTFFVGNIFPHLDLEFRENLLNVRCARARKLPKYAYPTHFAPQMGQLFEFSQI